ncbi:MAG: PolC-type DNA polymerase III N-terminal domain-containing protein, partial [Agathobacter sp.]|nr:PolC-type DNA polymerase III N-terminal domain-containing protein [Agathobacter sp.]
MTKTFKDVFPTLKLDDEMWHLLDNTDVTKISANHDHNHIRIYLRAKRLIFKKNLWILEKEIQSQIFRDKNVDVSIIESFELSEQYTPESLFDIYFDSILKELENYSILEYNLLRTATIEFDKINHMILTVDNTIIAKTRTDEIVEFLEKIVCERCGMDLIIQVEYREPKESKYRKNSVKQIEQEVQNIISRTKFAFDDETKTEEENIPEEATTKEKEHVAKKNVEAKPVKKENDPEVKSEKKGEFRKKYDSNPDVIYGRDFDDETIEIEKIDGPIGEVAIRGKILSLDTREIRNEKTIVIFSITDFTDTIVVKLFARNDDLDDILDGISPGKFIKLKGVPNIDKFDGDLTIGSIAGVKKIPDFTSIRMDNSVEKRVELHCHTKMSDMDGVSDVK